MKKLITLVACLIALPAAAANLAPPAAAQSSPVTCTVATCSGPYVGGGIEGAGPIGTGQADLTNGVGINAHVGYQFWNGSIFGAVEVGGTGYFGASTFTPAPGLTVGPGQWSADYVVKAGYGLQGVLSTGSVTTPSQGLFANLSSNFVSPYIEAGGRTRGFEGVGVKTGFLSGAGLEYAIGNGWNINVEYLHINYNTTTNGVSIGTENVAKISLNRMF